MFGKHLAERLAKIRPRPPLDSKLFAAIERGAAMTRCTTAIRQRFYPVVNQAVFGRVDLRQGVFRLSQSRMVIMERVDRSPAVVANAKVFSNARRVTFA